MADDPYGVLGVSGDASDAEIQRAYRRLARQYHPDRNPDDAAAEARFKAIQDSYDAIGTKESRQSYEDQKRASSFFGGQSWGSSPSSFSAEEFDLSDLINQFMHTGGRQGPSRSSSPLASDVHQRIELSLDQAMKGTKIRLKFGAREVCPTCSGQGLASNGFPCNPCSGTGQRKASRSVEASIPSGVTHGTTMRVKGQGNGGVDGSGDLLVEVGIDPGEGRRWEGGRLIQEVSVSVSTLMGGGTIGLTTPKGDKVSVRLVEGSRPGDRRRLPGQGPGGTDLDIELVVIWPDDLTDDQRGALNDLSSSGL